MEQAASVNADPVERSGSNGRCTQWRNWTGFWLLGLCNNFAYVIMLSAAHDILKKQESENSTAPTSASSAVDFRNSSNSSRYDCSPVSTAAVLLADILPTLVIKLSAPFVIHKLPYSIRVLICAIMAATSFLFVSFSSAVWMSILGVIYASISSGLGELSFLSLTVYFSRDVLAGWGSGTGGAGVAGALLYSGLTQVGLSPQETLLIMLVVPFAMLICYFFLLVLPRSLPQWKSRDTEYTAVGSEERQQLMDGSEEEEQEKSTPEDRTTSTLNLTEKLHVIKGLLKFVFPLGLVYFAEYFINQGLVLNAVLLLFAVRYQFLPSVWLVFVIILYEGLLGGAAYVNTFYFISKETEDRQREFAMAAASVGDSLGIALAGLTALPVHRYFCSL